MEMYHHQEIDTKCSNTEELMLTSDELSALDNMSMWMVNGDFKSCHKKGQRETWLSLIICTTHIHSISFL